MIGGIGTVAGIGLEEFVPDQDAVLVAEFVEVFAGALAHPVADQVEVGELVHANLGFEALAGNALEGFVEAPVAAADEDLDAVDGDGERVGAGHAVGDLADAEVDVLRVGDVVVDVEAEMKVVEILRAVAVGPPEARMLDVQSRGGLCVEADELVCCAEQGRLAAGRRCFRWCLRMTAFCGLSVTFSTVACTATSEESVRGSGRSVVTSGSLTSTGPVAERKTFCQMPVSRSRMAGIQSQPMVQRKVGPSMAVIAAVGADAVAQGVLVRNAGVGLRRDQHGEDGLVVPGFTLRGDVEDAANEGAARCADLRRR